MSASFGGRFAAIVGGPRCGTTSFARWLGAHPDVCFSTPKEPHFFTMHDFAGCSDTGLRDVASHEYLDRYFADCGSEKMLAEGSVSYLYAAERMEPLLKLWPDAKFIIGVRDPMKMLPSLYQRLLVTGDETAPDFDTAWRLVEDRRQGRNVPKSCIDPRFLDYEASGQFGTFVERFFETVGRERCHVVVHDDLVSDPAKVYSDLLAFLGLAAHERRDFSAKRSAQGFKFGWLQRLLKRPPVATRAVLAGEKYRTRVKSVEKKQQSALTAAIMRLRKRILRWNKAPAKPVRMSLDVRRDIANRLSPEIEKLGLLLGRDLGHWLSVDPPQKSSSARR